MPTDFLKKLLRSYVAVVLFCSVTLWGAQTEDDAISVAWAVVHKAFDLPEDFIDDPLFLSFSFKKSRSLEKKLQESFEKRSDTVELIKDLLKINDMNELFIYLAFIESRFNPQAVSNKNAVGIWQFIYSTAKMMQLDISYGYDERKDVYASTIAAIDYLKYLKQRFGKWYLAIFAYNAGEGRIASLIQKAGTDDVSVLLRHPSMPKETKNYLMYITLSALIGSKASLPDYLEASYATRVDPKYGIKLQTIAKLLDMPTAILKRYNPQVQNDVVGFDVEDFYIPKPLVFAYYLKVMPYENLCDSAILYQVQIDDTIEKIAKKYDTTVEKIRSCMHEKRDYLYVGELLKIP